MIKLIKEEGVELPSKGSEQAVGYDIVAFDIINIFREDREISEENLIKAKKGFLTQGYIKLRKHERILFSTGLTISDMPEDVELQVRSRSGLTLKKGLIVANQPGTIDPDYRGIIGVILLNTGDNLVQINRFDKIAQIVPNTIKQVGFEEVCFIRETERGANGFGSTGN
ncbi:MAG: dUTP diphosphatase [Fusobacteriaceae bacterium]